VTRLTEGLATEQLEVTGVLSADPSDNLHHTIRSIVLLSPAPGFWAHFTRSGEFADGQPDPMDRWSRRVIGQLACDHGGKAYFPFGGPPYRPFLAWAKRSGQAWVSPVGPLVHDRQGLMISYRGALGLTEPLDQTPGQNPCATCPAPCVTACPVGAMGAKPYDVPKCKAFLDTGAGSGCMGAGCLVRRACPVGPGIRQPEQLAFHMKAFNPR
jgi:epoxyqueuosine reductase